MGQGRETYPEGPHPVVDRRSVLQGKTKYFFLKKILAAAHYRAGATNGFPLYFQYLLLLEFKLFFGNQAALVQLGNALDIIYVFGSLF